MDTLKNATPRTPHLQTFLAFGFCLLAGIVSSCTLRQPARPPVPGSAQVSSTELPTGEQLLAPLRLRQQQLTSLRGLARVTYKDSEEKGSARQAVAVAAPDQVRVELFSPIGIAALIASDGQRLAAYFPKEKTIYRGVASAENAARFLRIMLSSSDIVSLLFGLPFSIPSPEQSAVSFDAERNWYTLTTTDEDQRKQTLIFDARKRHLLRWEVWSEENILLAQMVLSDYRVIQGQEFPFAIELTDIQGKQEAGIYYERVEINPTLTNSLFTIAPINGVQEVDLDTSTP